MSARLAFVCLLFCSAPVAAHDITPCDERCDPDRVTPRSITVLQAASGTLLVPVGSVLVMLGAYLERPCTSTWDERAFDPTPCTPARTDISLFAIGGVSVACGITLTTNGLVPGRQRLAHRWLRVHHFGIAPSIARRSAGLTLSLAF